MEDRKMEVNRVVNYINGHEVVDKKSREEIKEVKKEQLEIEDELKFTQVAVIMVVIMNIILVSLFLYVAFG